MNELMLFNPLNDTPPPPTEGTSALFNCGGGYGGVNLLKINSLGVRVFYTLNVDVLGTFGPGGVGFGDLALFFGGQPPNSDQPTNLVHRVSPAGTTLSITSAANPRIRCAAGRAENNAIFFGGWDNDGDVGRWLIRISSLGVVVGSSYTSGHNRVGFDGVTFDTFVMFFGGGSYTGNWSNNLIAYNSAGSVAISSTSLGAFGISRSNHAGARAGVLALFQGGSSTPSSSLDRFNNIGSIVGTRIVVGGDRQSHAAAEVGENALFYGGTVASVVRSCSILNESGTQIIFQENLTADTHTNIAGASVNT